MARRETVKWMRDEIEHNRHLEDKVSPGKGLALFLESDLALIRTKFENNLPRLVER